MKKLNLWENSKNHILNRVRSYEECQYCGDYSEYPPMVMTFGTNHCLFCATHTIDSQMRLAT